MHAEAGKSKIVRITRKVVERSVGGDAAAAAKNPVKQAKDWGWGGVERSAAAAENPVERAKDWGWGGVERSAAAVAARVERKVAQGI